MPSIQPSGHILFHRRQALPRDNLGPDRRLDRDLEELTGDDFFCETDEGESGSDPSVAVGTLRDEPPTQFGDPFTSDGHSRCSMYDH